MTVIPRQTRREALTQAASGGRRPGRIAGLDGVRGLAALSVVAIHLGLFADLSPAQFALVQPVLVFFVLSGFLITRNLLIEQYRTQRIDLRRFWWHRAVRLVPCYAMVLLTVCVLIGIGGLLGTTIISPVSTRHYVLSWLYLSNFVDTAHYSHPIAAMWSLAVEEHYYLLWPLVLAGASLLGTRARAPRSLAHSRAVPGAILALLTLCLLVRVAATTHPALFAGFIWQRFTVPCIDALALGSLLAWLAARHDPMIATRSRAPRRWGVGALALIAYSAPWWLDTLGVAARVGAAPWAGEIIGYYLQTVGICAAIWFVVLAQRGLAVRLLELRPLRWLGMVSYGIYLWQGVIIGTGPSDQRHPWQRGVLAVALILAVAAASWYLIEAPVSRWGRAAWNSPTAPRESVRTPGPAPRIFIEYPLESEPPGLAQRGSTAVVAQREK